jgi:hypothetical protein
MECIKNKDCTSGFCEKGVCKTPSFLDPCNVLDDQCSDPQVCSPSTNRCVFKNTNKDDGRKCVSDLQCSPDKRCENSFCTIRKSVGASCTFDRDCTDGSSCENSKCAKKCDPSGESQFGCPSGQECLERWSDEGYCVAKKASLKTTPITTPPPKDIPPPKDTTPSTPPPKENHDNGSGSAIFFISFIIGVVLLVVLIVLIVRKTKRSKKVPIMMQTTMPPPPPTYASPIIATPQHFVTPTAPSSPTYMATPSHQPPSYHGLSPGSSPHHYPGEKR